VSKLGVGLIGCGGMGRSLGKQLVGLETARLAGVADVSPEAVEKVSAELEAPGFPSAEALLERPDVDAVIIASPGFVHRPLSELAASRGKHIFLEKPMATNAADCDAIMGAADRAGVVLMVGQVLRYYPCWWQIIELVRRGEIGTPVGIHVTRVGGGFSGVWSQEWRNSLELSGGLLMEVNAHEIDFMCQVCGDVDRVYAEAGHYGDDPADYPNLYFVSLRFTSGAVGLLHSSTFSAMNDLSGKVQGTEGTVFYTNGFAADGEIRHGRGEGEPRTIRIGDIQVEPPVRRELRLFVEAVQTGSPVPIPGTEAKRNVAIAQAAYESARTGKPVSLGG
jgi:UDP-N-acetylglucosamine 3-dehydrogenase